MQPIDLRADTVTKPTPAMWRAMAAAEVGDDVFGEDPTINKLEEAAAEKMGKEAALYVPSGTMSNLVAVLTHCGRGDEIILGDKSHIFNNEQGGCAALGGVVPRIIPTAPDGRLGLDDIRAAVRPENIHFARPRLLALENTHNGCNGAPLDAAYMNAAADLAHELGLKAHVDGARIFNAAAAFGVPAKTLVETADSVSFCLSKGLAAPVGSLLCGSKDFILRARRTRKAVGGGMRQAGVLAAAGLVALNEMTDRLAEDHATARKLALGLADVKGVGIDPDQVKTNIVFFDVLKSGLDGPTFVEKLMAEGALMLAMGPRIRAVTHYHVSEDDIDRTLNAVRAALGR